MTVCTHILVCVVVFKGRFSLPAEGMYLVSLYCLQGHISLYVDLLMYIVFL